MELLDDGVEDLLDVGHGRQPGAERVGRGELARALAQALARLVAGVGPGRRSRRGGRGGAEAGLEAAGELGLGELGEEVRLAAAALLLAVQQRAVGAGDQLRRAQPRHPLGDAGGRAALR